MSNATELHLPEGINYECTSCGRCCGGWAVPMTAEDYDRISAEDWSGVHESYGNRTLFRELKKREREGTPYSHKIVSETGTCPFLVNNLCFIHSKRGAEFKPSICQLFPYCFSQTPSGVYATVSFVSAGAIYNSGKPLAEQKDVLEQKYKEFLRLYPDYQPDWSRTKLTVDQPITWDAYLNIEKKLLETLADKSTSLDDRLRQCSAYLVSNVKRNGGNSSGGNSSGGNSSGGNSSGGNSSGGNSSGNSSGNGGSATIAASAAETGTASNTTFDYSPLKPMDLSLLLTFHKMYFPVKPLRPAEGDFNIGRFLQQHFLGDKRLQLPKRALTLPQLKEIDWCEDDEIASILDRYMYSYIFGKKYFGAGFGQVSIIAGFHHLVLMLALIKLQSRASALLREAGSVNLLDVATTVRQMERQVGESKLGGYAAGAWELLLFSPGRASRFLANS